MTSGNSRSRESNENLIYNEVRNLAKRVNDFTNAIQALQDASQDHALDLEQLSSVVNQLRTRFEYLEELLKGLQRNR